MSTAVIEWVNQFPVHGVLLFRAYVHFKLVISGVSNKGLSITNFERKFNLEVLIMSGAGVS